MDNSTFVEEEIFPLVHQDEDYDDYNTRNTSKIGEALFMEPDTSEATSTLGLRQEVKLDKLAPSYRHLGVTGNPDPNMDQFRLTTDPKKGTTILEFYNGDRWVPLKKQESEFFAVKTLKDRFGSKQNEKFLGIGETPPALERSFKAATNLKAELRTDLEMESIPLKELSSLVKDIHVKAREASQNTDLDMREFLDIDKTLQSIQGGLLNNTYKLTEIDKRIQRDTKKLEEVENDPT